MKNEIRDLCDLKIKESNKKHLSEVFTENAQTISSTLSKEPSDMDVVGNLIGVFTGIRFFANGLGAFISEEVEKQVKRNKIAKILDCDKKEVALDMFSLNKDTKYLAGDLTYKANIDIEHLKQLKLIFGDAHLEALEDYSNLESLNMIFGDTYLRDDRTIEDLPTPVATYGEVYNQVNLRKRRK